MAFDPRRAFSRAEALAAGMTDWQLRSQQRLHRDVYVGAGVPLDTRVRALAALRLAPQGSLVARHTAALLLGGVVPEPAMVHLLVPDGRLRARGVDARPGRRTRWGRLGGIPLTSAEDTFLDLGGELGLVDLVVLGDSLVGKGRTSPEALRTAAGHARGPQAPTLRRAAELVRVGVDSAPESALRLLIVLAGLPEPVVNHTEYDERGWVRRRFDLSWPAKKLAVEYDGRQHAESQRQWEHDVARREGLDADGWRLVVVLARGLYREPGRTLERVTRAMGDVGLEGRPRSDEWRTFFPDRPRLLP
jgi:hypothetical protein